MIRSATLATCLATAVAMGSPTMLSATDSVGEGYGSWGQFHPYFCNKSDWKCTYWSDAATPSSPVYAQCSPLFKWQNGIDVEYCCDIE